MRWPRYKTQPEIVMSSMQRYAKDFLMMDDPMFSDKKALEILNVIWQAEYFIDIEEIFETL